MRSQDIAFEVEHTNVTKYFSKVVGAGSQDIGEQSDNTTCETCTRCTVLYTVHRVHWVLKNDISHMCTGVYTKIWDILPGLGNTQ